MLAAATDCSTNAVPDTNDVAVSIALYATVAATGDLTPAGTDPAFALKVFADDRTVTSGMAKLRFIHASPATPNVDVGVGTGASFSKLFANVAFGTAAAAAGSIDANGFLATTPLSGVNVTARLANASTDALTVPNVALPANAIATAFAIGGKTGFTTAARKTFVGAAARGGRRLVIAMMYGLVREGGPTYWDQAGSLFDWGFALNPQSSIGSL